MRMLILAGALALVVALSGCVYVNTNTGNRSSGPAVLNGVITEGGAEFGNLDTSITKAGVEAVGMQQGDTLSFSCGGSTFEVAYKTTYADVSEGAWVAFLNWDDKLRFARNRANAAETAVCKLDDAVTVSKAG